MLSVVLVVAMFAAACTPDSPSENGGPSTTVDADESTAPVGGGGEEATDGGRGTIDPDLAGVVNPELAALLAEAPPTATVVFASSDGSAHVGSRTVFTVTNTETAQSYLVAVDGADEGTRAEIQLPPGTYSVRSDDPQIAPTGTTVVRDLEPAEIFIPEAAAPPEAEITVLFSLDVQPSPVVLQLDGLTATTAELSWGTTSSVQVEEFVLRRVPGPDPAQDRSDGEPAGSVSPGATSTVVTGLEPGAVYTFTLFSTAVTGDDLEVRSLTVTTPRADGTTSAYVLAPNTIAPTDLDALDPVGLGESLVGVNLSGTAGQRSSLTQMPGIDAADLEAGCVVGMPFLVSTEVAGEEGFYGVVAACGETVQSVVSPAGTGSGPMAVVDTDVPLAAVFPYLAFSSSQAGGCYDGTNFGEDLGEGDPLCAGEDSDGDGVSDGTERALGLDPRNAEDGWESWTDELTGDDDAPSGPPTVVDDLVAPDGLATGELQITLLWATGDDLDLYVDTPAGSTIFYGDKTLEGGVLDTDDRGDRSCRSTQTRAENVAFSEPAGGTYTIRVEQFLGSAGSPRPACSSTPEARLEVRLGDNVETYTVSVGVDGPITVDVPFDDVEIDRAVEPASGSDEPQGLQRVDDLGAGSAIALASVRPELAPNVVCEGVGNITFETGFGFEPFHKADVELKLGELKWDIEAGLTVYVDPSVTAEAGFECALDLEGATFQLMTTPVPINLELVPIVEGGLTGNFQLKGPRLELTLGISSEGYVDASLETCGWFDFPCGVELDTFVDAQPIGALSHGPAEVSFNGELGIGVGVEATIGVGFKNALVTAKTGFAISLKPAVAKVGASAGIAAELDDGVPTTTEPPQLRPVDGLYKEWAGGLAGPFADWGWGEHDLVGPLDYDAQGIGTFSCFGGHRPLFANPVIDREILLYVCPDAQCLSGDRPGPIHTFRDGCEEARCFARDEVVNAGADDDLVAECPQYPDTPADDLPLVGSPPNPVFAIPDPSPPPPYQLADLKEVWLRAAERARQDSEIQEWDANHRVFLDGVVIDGVPHVGFSAASRCGRSLLPADFEPRRVRPVPPAALAPDGYVVCPDAFCLDEVPERDGLQGLLESQKHPIYTDTNECLAARCAFTGEVVDAGRSADGVAECPQDHGGTDALVSARRSSPDDETATSVNVDLLACATASIGAEVGVDFRAETFVLGWGKDRRYTIWEGEFEYPGASFEIGDCPE